MKSANRLAFFVHGARCRTPVHRERSEQRLAQNDSTRRVEAEGRSKSEPRYQVKSADRLAFFVYGARCRTPVYRERSEQRLAQSDSTRRVEAEGRSKSEPRYHSLQKANLRVGLFGSAGTSVTVEEPKDVRRSLGGGGLVCACPRF